MDRRDFLKTAAAVPAAAVTPSASPPASNQQQGSPAEAPTISRPGSDFMVDVLKSLNFEFVFSNPANTFRSLHESLINYGGNSQPEFITCPHEEIATAMAHGYAKIEGRPALVALHGTVGTQHASMAVYDAFCDRVPVYLILGNHLDAGSAHAGGVGPQRAGRGGDHPRLRQVGRCARIADAFRRIGCPRVQDRHDAADGAGRDRRGRRPAGASRPSGRGAAHSEARGVRAADRRCRRRRRSRPAARRRRESRARRRPGRAHAGRIDAPRRACRRTAGGRDRSQRAHELSDAPPARSDEPHRRGARRRRSRRRARGGGLRERAIRKAGAKRVSITANDLFTRSNYQDFQRFAEVDLAIAADAEATLPSLVEAVKRRMTADRRTYGQSRGAQLAQAHQQALDDTREAAAQGWDSSPISTARLSAELWAQIKDDDWSLVADVIFMQNWPLRLWTMDKHHHYIGGPGGLRRRLRRAGGGGSGAREQETRAPVREHPERRRPDVRARHAVDRGASPHSAADRDAQQPRLPPGSDGSAEDGARARPQCTSAHIGTKLDDPPIDYAKLAQSMGVYGEGPISNPKDLGPAIRRAIDVVKRGEPALVDVLTQPR